jgi:hypothetical protein
MEKAPHHRGRLTIADAALLVAAGAVGLAVLRLILPLMAWPLSWNYIASKPPQGWTARLVLERALMAQVPTIPFAAAWTVVLPVLLLRRAGPTWRRIVRWPGTVACLAAVMGWACVTTCAGPLILRSAAGSLRLGAWIGTYLDWIFPPIGLSVAIAWATLALTGRWRAVPDWSDRLGRALGVYWIATGLQYECYFFILLA